MFSDWNLVNYNLTNYELYSPIKTHCVYTHNIRKQRAEHPPPSPKHSAIIKNARCSTYTLHCIIVYYRAEGLCILHLIPLSKFHLPVLHAHALSSETRQKTDMRFLTNAPLVDAIKSRASSTCLAFFETSDVDSAHCYVFKNDKFVTKC